MSSIFFPIRWFSHWPIFWFMSEGFVISFSAVADGKPLPLPIIASMFRFPPVLFCRSRKSGGFRHCGRPHILWLRRCGCQSSKLSEPLVFLLPIQVSTLQTVVRFTVPPLRLKEAPALSMRSYFASDSDFTRSGLIYPPRLRRCGSGFTLVPTNSLPRFR